MRVASGGWQRLPGAMEQEAGGGGETMEANKQIPGCPDHPFSGGRLEMTPHTIHYGKMVCPTCGRFLCWVSKPDGEKRNRRESQKLKHVFDSAGVDYCQMCLRPKCELPPHVTLIIHHVVEVQDGGIDSPSNTWRLCTICHEMVHLMRRNRSNPKERPTVVPVLEAA